MRSSSSTVINHTDANKLANKCVDRIFAMFAVLFIFYFTILYYIWICLRAFKNYFFFIFFVLLSFLIGMVLYMMDWTHKNLFFFIWIIHFNTEEINWKIGKVYLINRPNKRGERGGIPSGSSVFRVPVFLINTIVSWINYVQI